MTRTFKPTVFTSGARVEWTHTLHDGTEVTRTGIVWDRAPSAPRYTMVAWVTPDVPLPGDLYSALAVGKRFVNTAEWIDGKRVKREVYESTDSINDSLGSMTVGAWRHADRTRKGRVA